jgi:probable phosphoglycerate mutase
MSILLLVRHATNDWVGSGRLAGRTPGVFLNARGRAEAAALAARLALHPIEAVYTSPLARTLETARYLASTRGLEPILTEGIQEVDFGDWTGRELDSLRKDPLWSGVQHRPSLTRFPGGETLGEAQARAVTAIEAIRARHPEGMVAAVSHADVIKALLAHYAGTHLDLFQRIEVSPASVSVIAFGPSGPSILAQNALGFVPMPSPPSKPTTEAIA